MINDLPTVLIVDDEPGLLRSLMAFFEDENFSVAGAKSGEEALQLLNKEQFDAVILDMRLPGIDGNEVVLQAKQRGCTAKFFIHTGSTDYILPSALIELGIRPEQVFHKPVYNLEELTRTVAQVISHPPPQQTAANRLQ